MTDLLPELSRELAHGLMEARQTELSAQIATLRIGELCGCGDDFCSSFYTGPKPTRPYDGFFQNLMPPVDSGTVILDVVEGLITYVEVLFRDDVKDIINSHRG